MRRGEIWSVSAGSGYGGKPRPAVIIQDDHFSATASVTVALFTSDPTVAPIFRPVISPDASNNLRSTSSLMVDKIMTIPRAKMGHHIGRLSDSDNFTLDQAILVFLGLAD